jgi:hypothetical protein
MLPLEGTLLEKLRKIEALHAGTSVDGEREAARRAAERIRARLAELRGRETDEELVYSTQFPTPGSVSFSSRCAGATSSNRTASAAVPTAQSLSVLRRRSSTEPSGRSSSPYPKSFMRISTS